MRRTDFCLLTFFVRALVPCGFPVASRCACARRSNPGRFACFTAERLASAGYTFMRLGVLVPRCKTREPNLWHPCRDSRDALPARTDYPPAENRRDRSPPARVNDASREAIRDAFRRSRTFAPQHPFECPAPDFHRLMAWPPCPCFSSSLSRTQDSCEPPRTLGLRPRVPLPFGSTLLKTNVTLADFCNLVTTHEHTLRAFQSSRASGALAPLHAGTNRCRLRWPGRCVAASWGR